MADINVERGGPNIWPWIIGLVVLALLIWAIAEMAGTDDRDATVAPATQEVAPTTAPATAPATDPATGTWVDPATPTTDPAAGTTAPGTMDPATGAPGTTPTTDPAGVGTTGQSPPR